MSIRLSDPQRISQLTIYRQREFHHRGSSLISFAESVRVPTDFVNRLINIDKYKWTNRRELFVTLFSLCLSLASLWRFPQQALLHGHGTFMWLYVMFTLLIGSSMVYFELALGQQSSKGFSEVFSMCPIFEGISYSMACYCATVAIFYNMLNVFSFKYMYYSFWQVLPYAECKSGWKSCLPDAKNQSSSPEYIFFQMRVVRFSDKDINWSEIGILFVLWVSICIALLRGIRILRLVNFIFCLSPFLILTATLCSICSYDGVGEGISALFVPTMPQFLDPMTWIFAFEQTLVTLGLGMGPFISIGAYTRCRHSPHLDSLVLCVVTTINTILAGMVLFGVVGILAKERGQTMQTVLKINETYEDIYVHVIFSQLFSRLPFGFAQFLSFLFFMMLFYVGWYSLIVYTDIFVTVLYSLANLQGKYKTHAYIVVCSLCFMLGCAMATVDGYILMQSLNHYFTGMGLMLMALFEMIGFMYIYGVFALSEDIDFVLDYYPNIFYQITWICIPVALAISIGFDLASVYSARINSYDIMILVVLVIFILLPIILRGIWNVCVYYEDGDLIGVFSPRADVVRMQPADSIFMTPGYFKSTGSVRRLSRSPSIMTSTSL